MRARRAARTVLPRRPAWAPRTNHLQGGPFMASRVGAGDGPTVAPVTRDRYDTDEDAGYGWVAFAGTMIAIAGILNCIYGIAAISNSRFYARDVTYIIGDLNAWGWALLLLGLVQFLSAFGILAQ